MVGIEHASTRIFHDVYHPFQGIKPHLHILLLHVQQGKGSPSLCCDSPHRATAFQRIYFQHAIHAFNVGLCRLHDKDATDQSVALQAFQGLRQFFLACHRKEAIYQLSHILLFCFYDPFLFGATPWGADFLDRANIRKNLVLWVLSLTFQLTFSFHAP